jgi:hypothetical protein
MRINNILLSLGLATLTLTPTPMYKPLESYTPVQLNTPSTDCYSVPVRGELSSIGTRYCICCSKFRWRVWGHQVQEKEEYYTTCLCPE